MRINKKKKELKIRESVENRWMIWPLMLFNRNVEIYIYTHTLLEIYIYTHIYKYIVNYSVPMMSNTVASCLSVDLTNWSSWLDPVQFVQVRVRDKSMDCKTYNPYPIFWWSSQFSLYLPCSTNKRTNKERIVKNKMFSNT